VVWGCRVGVRRHRHRRDVRRAGSEWGVIVQVVPWVQLGSICLREDGCGCQTKIRWMVAGGCRVWPSVEVRRRRCRRQIRRVGSEWVVICQVVQWI
jgi:hypothetical protein